MSDPLMKLAIAIAANLLLASTAVHANDLEVIIWQVDGEIVSLTRQDYGSSSLTTGPDTSITTIRYDNLEISTGRLLGEGVDITSYDYDQLGIRQFSGTLGSGEVDITTSPTEE